MRSPRDIIASQQGRQPPGPESEERFLGYGVMSCPFSSGHQLSLRHFATSVGAPYTSVWHCDPAGKWTFYADAAPELSCSRYFGRDLERAAVTPITVEWTGGHAFTVTMPEVPFRWDLTLAPAPMTRVMNAVGRAVPDRLWWSPRFLGLMSRIAGPALNAGHLALAGATPNGQYYRATPRLIWTLSASTASLNGEDLGQLSRARSQQRLGDFWIPARPLFAIGEARFEAYDPARHIIGLPADRAMRA